MPKYAFKYEIWAYLDKKLSMGIKKLAVDKNNDQNRNEKAQHYVKLRQRKTRQLAESQFYLD